MSQLLLATTQLTPPPEVFLYIRMSTTEQLTGDSLRRQRDLGTLYAEQNNLVLPEHNILQDIGLSAYTGVNLQKGELGLFMERLQLGKIKPGSFLLVESIDRLSRQSIIDGLGLFCELLQKGLVIITLSDGRIHSKETTRLENILTSTMTISRANEESVMKSVRGSESWKNKRANAGIKKLTRLCSKWMIPDSKLTCFQLIPDRADIVRRIFREARSGLGAYKIASRLNAEKIPTFGPSKGWAKSSVTKILKSGAVIGEFQPHQKINGKRIPIGDPIQNYFPSIVSKQDFDLVQVEKAARRTAGVGRKGANYNNLFTGLAVCGQCGSTMQFESKGNPPKGGNYLFCSGSRRHSCNAKSWRYELFERTFLSNVRELDLNQLFSSGPSEIEGLRLLIAEKSRELLNLKDRMNGLDHLFVNKNPDRDYIEQRLAELGEQSRNVTETKIRLERRCDELSAQAQAMSGNALALLIEDIRKGTGDVYLKRSIIARRVRILVEQIVVFPQVEDKAIILNWANKKVTQLSLDDASLPAKDSDTPMFEVGLSDGKKKRFLLNYSPGNTDSVDSNLINNKN